MEQKISKNRIAELDAARGIALLCMVAIHVFSIGEKFGGMEVVWHPFFRFVKQYCGAFFVILSGICVTLGKKCIKRGLVVFMCGMVLTGLTFWLYYSGRENEHILIQWGVLHCLGTCMMLWPLFRKIPTWPRMVLGAVIVVVGYYLRLQVHVRNPWLYPLGLRTWYFTTFDYFPLMPHLGWFLLGSGLGDLIYKDRNPLIPALKPGLFAFCGRHSLEIYMIHFPVLYIFFKFGVRQ